MIRQRLGLEIYERIFTLTLQALREHGLLRGKNLGIDASVIEANASLRALVNRNTEEQYWDYVKGLAAEQGIDPEDTTAVRKFDRHRPGKGSNKEWVYNTNTSYVLKKIGPYETISYTETNVPWPGSNRDVLLHMQLLPDSKSNTLKVIAKGMPDIIPHKKGIVRIPYFNSWWDVKYDGRNKLTIVYFLEMDPGGSVPAWLVNLFIAKGPYETFTGLVKVMR